MNENIFRAYDIRGVYPKDINEKVVFYITKNFKKIFPNGKKIVVGHDARNSSPSLYKFATLGFKSCGFKVVEIGMMTSPMLVFSVNRAKSDGGITITASHNPKNNNGIKIVDKNGMSIGGIDVLKKIGTNNLKEYENNFSYDKNFKSRKYTEKFQIAYADFLNSFFDIKKEMRVVFDSSNGAAGPILKKIKFPKNIKAIFVNNKTDGNFPGHGPDPTISGATNQVSKEIIKNRADFGVVFDGDGDRAVFVDDKGDLIRPEYIWRLLMTKENYKKAVYNAPCDFMMNMVAEEIKSEASNYEAKLFIVRVGHTFVKKMVKKINADIGIESSGHYMFKEFFNSDSGLLAAIKVANAISYLPYKFSDFLNFMPKTHRIPETNIEMKRPDFERAVKNISDKFKKLGKISFLDGISVRGKDFWFNIRQSNTQNLTRINIEGFDNKKVLTLKNTILNILKRSAS